MCDVLLNAGCRGSATTVDAGWDVMDADDMAATSDVVLNVDTVDADADVITGDVADVGNSVDVCDAVPRSCCCCNCCIYHARASMGVICMCCAMTRQSKLCCSTSDMMSGACVCDAWREDGCDVCVSDACNDMAGVPWMDDEGCICCREACIGVSDMGADGL